MLSEAQAILTIHSVDSQYMGVLPFFINVEMPTHSRQGEQVGIRVTVFNYMKTAIEAIVLLEGSDAYKFVHVEEEGIVSGIFIVSLSTSVRLMTEFVLGEFIQPENHVRRASILRLHQTSGRGHRLPAHSAGTVGRRARICPRYDSHCHR